jgi:hypothetical protein
MATVYTALGDALVSQDELYEKQAEGELQGFKEGYLDAAQTAPPVEFATGALTQDNVISNYTVATGERVDFVPVGIGKPLTVEIRHVYTGRFPETRIFSKKNDMMITSAMKSIATFNAQPRALNFLHEDVEARHNVRSPAATEQGTPLVYYTPALLERASVLTLEIGFDEFPEEVFGMVSDAFQEAAGVPVFLSHSVYLLAAGAITKIVGEIGHRLFDEGPIFRATVPLSFVRPGEIAPVADFKLVGEDDVSPSLLRDYKVNADGVLQHVESGEPFSGDTPYIVISLDGRENKDYENFAPTAASATLLERFFGLSDGQEKPLGPLLDALKLYNDWKFRQKADELQKDLAELDPSSSEYAQRSQEYEAAKANILNDLLKPPAEVPA